jgi:hypothetical protein
MGVAMTKSDVEAKLVLVRVIVEYLSVQLAKYRKKERDLRAKLREKREGSTCQTSGNQVSVS